MSRGGGSRGALAVGAAHGARVWAAYWVIECALLVVVPWLRQPPYLYRPLSGAMTTLLLAVYAALGAVLGCVGAAVLARGGATAPRLAAAGALGLPVAFELAFLSEVRIRSSEAFQASWIALVAIGLASAARSERWADRLEPLSRPWVLPLLLLCGPWIRTQIPGSPIRAALLVVAASAAVVAVERLARRVEAGRPAADAVLGALVVTALGLGVALDQAPLVRPAPEGSRGTNRKPPDVVLITLDTVRADHCSLYGYSRRTTPNLERFAAGANLYRRAVASSDMTLPTHGSLFTGLYASRHGARYALGAPGLVTPLKEGIPTLAEILERNGYDTAGIVANHGYLQHSFGLDRGFAYYDQRVPVPFLGEVELISLRRGVRAVLKRFASPSDFDTMYRRAGEIGGEALRFLEDPRRGRRPFFLFLNYMDAHQPYYPAPPFDSLFPGRLPGFTFERFDRIHREVLEGKHALTDAERGHLLSQYDGGIAYLDDRIGWLLDRIRALGLYDNALVVITSDHGEAFGERGLIEHGVSVYQDQVRIPLVVKLPRQTRGEVVDDLVGSVDVMPTILEALGLEVPAGLEGRSALAGGGAPRTEFSEHFPSDWQIERNPALRRGFRAVFEGDWKLIVSTAGTREVFNLAADPDERDDVASRETARAARLQSRLDAWIRTLPPDSRRETSVDPETLRRLRSLGYVR